MTHHQSVLLKEVINHLSPQANENFIDATINGGGHALVVLEKISPNGRLLGIDLSEKAIEEFKSRIKNLKLGKRIILINDNFANLSQIVKKNNFQPVNGIIADLGLSTDLLEQSGQGFSFQKNEFLDMRFGRNGKTAYEIINQSPLKQLKKIFKEYGEESFSNLIAEEIIKSRRKEKISTTSDLVAAIKQVVEKRVPLRFHSKVFARIFQALRIAVNHELENLEKFLNQSTDILAKNGKLAVISFHSLEDRIVKNFFRQKKKEGVLKILTKKPITACFEERKNNPRSRSAKLRVAQKQFV